MKKLISVLILLIVLVLTLSLPVYSENLGLTNEEIKEYAKAQRDAYKYELLYEKERERYMFGILHEQAFWMMVGMGVGIYVR